MTAAFHKIASALKDIQARRYRSITYTEDGTVIIVDAETGKSASGRNLKEAESNFRSAA
ncbi:hypothetical protein HJB86_14690 [Rhizobium sp. NZLR3b]|uniref:hypothetical protein n=1 Tax=Rhizobium sp. NZLR3b TaxID=2731101 RepID=UPI001C833602|nr:hypothetical protein [Rhizobium sp. NZLR3b]MBX5190155.1 hypothetical protein [Rhizobium sp. NZLR3b]